MRGSLLSDALLYLGEWESCEKQAPAIISLAKELGEKNLWAPYYTLAYIAAARGHLPEAREMLECALGPANRSGWPELLIGCYMVRAKIHLAENKLSEAEKNLLVAIEQGKKMTFGFSTFEPILELVRLGLKKGDLEEASAYYTTLQKKASEVGENWAFAIELWAKGLVSEARGNVMEGIEALEKSVELFQLVGRKYDLAQTLVDLSRLETKAHQTRKAEEASAEAGRMLGQLGIGQPRHV